MKSQKFGIMLVLISGIMWGFSGVIGQYIFLNSTMNSVQLSIIRQFVSGIILLTISVIKKDKKFIQKIQDEQKEILNEYLKDI